jgi:hypothetical protein
MSGDAPDNAQWDPLAMLDPNSPSFLEDARALAQSLTAGEGCWEDSARDSQAAVIMLQALEVADEDH